MDETVDERYARYGLQPPRRAVARAVDEVFDDADVVDDGDGKPRSRVWRGHEPGRPVSLTFRWDDPVPEDVALAALRKHYGQHHVLAEGAVVWIP
jgi:hypothetical protein